jgi:ligand-binding SRPBCC domain-containing protein
MKPYEMFADKMTKGDFVSFEHEHYFKPADNGTIIIDIINFETPYGWLGRMLNKFYLTSYLEKMIGIRNETVRQYAVSDKWRALLHNR